MGIHDPYCRLTVAKKFVDLLNAQTGFRHAARMCDAISDTPVPVELCCIWCRSVELFPYELHPSQQRWSFAVPRPHEIPIHDEGSDSVIHCYPSKEHGCAQMALFHTSSAHRIRGPLGLKKIIVRIFDCREVGELAHKCSERIVAPLEAFRALRRSTHKLAPRFAWQLHSNKLRPPCVNNKR